jgi:hypothetical protein
MMIAKKRSIRDFPSVEASDEVARGSAESGAEPNMGSTCFLGLIAPRFSSTVPG